MLAVDGSGTPWMFNIALKIYHPKRKVLAGVKPSFFRGCKHNKDH